MKKGIIIGIIIAIVASIVIASAYMTKQNVDETEVELSETEVELSETEELIPEEPSGTHYDIQLEESMSMKSNPP